LRVSPLLVILIAGVSPMFLVAGLIILSTLQPVAWTPPLLRTHHLGNPELSSDITSGVADSSGLYVAGFIDRTPTLGVNVNSGTPFLSKYDTSGNLVWNHDLLGTPDVSPMVSIGADGVYVELSGPSNETIFRFDDSGSILWNITIQPSIGLEQIAPMANGIVVAGSSNYSLTNQTLTGSRFTFVRDYDPNGRILWTSEFSNSTTDTVLGVSAGPSGLYVLTQQSLVGYSLDGHQLWVDPMGGLPSTTPTSISSDSTGVYVTGTTQASTLDLQLGFLAKYDFIGNIIWYETFPTPDYSGVASTAVSADVSGVYISMNSGVGHDFILSYDSNGNQAWIVQTAFTTNGENLLVTSGASEFYVAGAVPSLPGNQGLVQGFSRESALVFFGVNPPFSYILILSIIVIVGLSMFFLRRRYTRKTAMRKQMTAKMGFQGRDLSP
jgi:hypothetical protein